MTRSAPIRPARELKSDAGDETKCAHVVIDEIAGELNLLSESRINPDAFFERRDYLVKRLRRLAKRLGSEPQRTTAPGSVVVTGRTSVKPPPTPRLEVHFARGTAVRSTPRKTLRLKGC